MLSHRLRRRLNIKLILCDVLCLLGDSAVSFSRQSAACHFLEIGNVNLEDDSTNPDGREYPLAVTTDNGKWKNHVGQRNTQYGRQNNHEEQRNTHYGQQNTHYGQRNTHYGQRNSRDG